MFVGRAEDLTTRVLRVLQHWSALLLCYMCFINKLAWYGNTCQECIDVSSGKKSYKCVG